jgi:RNA polymerase sigma-70 factor (ECF subfamily)
MKVLETTAATIEFEIVENAGRDADPRLADAVSCGGGAKAVLQAIVAARAETASCVDRRHLRSEVEEMNGSGPSMTTRIDRDGPLVAALRRGDPTAGEDLVAVYGDRAWRLAMRITGNAQDAEEGVQDAFLSVIRKIDTFRGDSAFRSWLYRIVANAAYQHCRRRRGRSADVSLDQVLPVFDEDGRRVAPVADWSMSVDDPARQTELRIVLDTAIEELPGDYRAVVLLRDVEGLSQQETAEALGLPVVNVKTLLHRARLFLRKGLEAHLSGQRSIASADRFRDGPRRLR